MNRIEFHPKQSLLKGEKIASIRQRSDEQDLAKWGVKKHIGVITNPSNGLSFRVFTTGDPAYVLFCLLDPNGCDTTIHFPIARKDLKCPLPRD